MGPVAPPSYLPLRLTQDREYSRQSSHDATVIGQVRELKTTEAASGSTWKLNSALTVTLPLPEIRKNACLHLLIQFNTLFLTQAVLFYT